MNRPIKFRAWDKQEKRMMIGVEGAYDYTNMYAPENVPATCFGQLLGNQNFDVMQFTGLLDKNGKEIWEGDIVRHYGKNKEMYFGMGGEGEPADYVGGYMGWCLGRDEETTGELNSEEMEVIGNIYENPELLK